MWTGLHSLEINIHCGQDGNDSYFTLWTQGGFNLELTLWTGWHWLGIFTVDRMALTLECEKIDFDLVSPYGQVGIDLEIILQTCWQ